MLLAIAKHCKAASRRDSDAPQTGLHGRHCQLCGKLHVFSVPAAHMTRDWEKTRVRCPSATSCFSRPITNTVLQEASKPAGGRGMMCW